MSSSKAVQEALENARIVALARQESVPDTRPPGESLYNVTVAADPALEIAGVPAGSRGSPSRRLPGSPAASVGTRPCRLPDMRRDGPEGTAPALPS